MRVLQLIILIGFASSLAVAAASTDFGTTGVVKVGSVNHLSRVLFADKAKRSLRRSDLDKQPETDSDDEERGGLDKVDDVVSKVDDLAGHAGKGQSNLDALIQKNYDEFAEFATQGKKLGKGLEFAQTGGKLKTLATKYKAELTEWSKLIKQLRGQYPEADKLTLSTLRQLGEIEDMRKVDVANKLKGTKSTPDGMRRKITPFPGMETPDPKYMISHIGRGDQRFGEDGSRLLSSAVVMRTNEQGQHQILLISSSNPKKGDFLLPKGGWDKGEDIETAALREVIEEGGVRAQLAHNLGELKFKDGDKSYTYFSYLMKSNKIYDDWAESIRYRLWVTLDDALVMLKGREHMVQLVKRAKAVDNQITAGIRPAVDADLGAFKLT
ncbi:hypothetical protein L917_01797 [Phytophthora nicotianae]|uniref:Nudix hydrolase domain-containing protein n=1 Tax=Phytophthora nicotianae TaxID=4792 RepID=W2LYC9_PHYNI|nr:hypothetical protein L917_01797 [Phytophthora nicotianae]